MPCPVKEIVVADNPLQGKVAGIIRRQASEPLPLMAAMGNNSTRPFPAEYLIPRLRLFYE